MENVFSSSYLKAGLKKTELVGRLSGLQRQLAGLGQEDRPKGLQATAALLVNERFIKHVDKDVRLLTACCLADILRIFAPEAPFGDEEMVSVFELFIHQLHSLSTHDANSTVGARTLYILNSLATVQSCVVPVLLMQRGVTRAEELVRSLFDALISSLRPEHSEEVLDHMTKILVACIAECDDLDQGLLDLILTPLLPSSRTENPMAYKLIVSTLNKVSSLKYIGPISRFFNEVLVGSFHSGERAESELADQVYPLIYETHKICPSLLQSVIPNICVHLESDEEEVRLKACKLLGKLFASESAEYGTEFRMSFKSYLGRFVDVSLAIRTEMTETGGVIMSKKAGLCRAVEDCMVKRLVDNEVDARVSAITWLLEIALQTPTKLAANTFRALGDRVRDRNNDIKKQVMLGLSKCYRMHVAAYVQTLVPSQSLQQRETKVSTKSKSDRSSRLKDSSSRRESGASTASMDSPTRKSLYSFDDENQITYFKSQIPAANLERLSFVPSLIINCWGYTDVGLRHLVLHLLQEFILPKKFVASDEDNSQVDTDDIFVSLSEDKSSALGKSAKAVVDDAESNNRRASALMLMFSHLTPAERSALGTILGAKTKVRLELASYLQARNQLYSLQQEQMHGQSSKDADDLADQADEAELAVKKSLNRVVASFPPSDKKLSVTEKLPTMKLLERCVLPDDAISLACNNREDLKQRLDSKSSLGQYFGMLYDTAGFLLVNTGVTECLLHFAVAAMKELHSQESSAQRAGGKKQKQSSEVSSSQLSELVSFVVDSAQLLSLSAKHAAPTFMGTASVLCAWIDVNCSTLSSRLPASLPANDCEDAMKQMLLAGSKVVLYSSQALGEACLGNSVDETAQLCSSLLSWALKYQDAEACEKLSEAALRLSLFAYEFASSTSRESILGRRSSARQTSKSSVKTGKAPRGKQSSDEGLDALDSDQEEEYSPVMAPVITTILQLASRAHLSMSNARLACDLRVLAALMKLPQVMTSTENLKPSFVASTLAQTIGSVKDIIVRFIRKELIGEGVVAKDALSQDKVLALGAGLRVWAAIASAAVVFGDEVSSTRASIRRSSVGNADSAHLTPVPTSSQPALAGFVVDLVNLLFHGIDSAGKAVGSARIESGDHSRIIREASASVMFSLLALDSVANTISVERWQHLAWTLLDEDLNVRRNLLGVVSSVIQSSVVHPRFLSYPVLLASDEALSVQAQNSLVFAIRRLRTTHEVLASRALANDDKDLRRQVEVNMPETILPYVLYLVSYHPEFPTDANIDSEEDKRRVRVIIQSIKMMISSLFATLKNETDNLSYLLKQVNTIARFYRDRLDNSNVGLHFAARLTVKILNDNIKTSENVQNYPGEVYLPADLFELMDLQRDPTKFSKDAAIMKTLERSEQIIDKVVMATGGGKLKQHVSSLQNGVTAGGSPNKKASVHQSRQPQPKKLVESKSSSRNKQDSESESEDEFSGNGRARSKVLSSVAVPPPPLVSHSSRPIRSTRVAVSYREKTESEKEVNMWEQQAEQAELAKKRKIERLSIGEAGESPQKESRHSGYKKPAPKVVSSLEFDSDGEVGQKRGSRKVEGKRSASLGKDRPSEDSSGRLSLASVSLSTSSNSPIESSISSRSFGTGSLSEDVPKQLVKKIPLAPRETNLPKEKTSSDKGSAVNRGQKRSAGPEEPSEDEAAGKKTKAASSKGQQTSMTSFVTKKVPVTSSNSSDVSSSQTRQSTRSKSSALIR